MTLSPIDLAILLAWLGAMVVLGLRAGGRVSSGVDFALAGRDLPAGAILLSVVATETSTVTFLSVPSLAFRGDLTFLQLPLGYILGRALVVGLLLPRYFEGHDVSAYALLRRRFGPGAQRAASLIFLLARNAGDGLRLFLGALVLVEVCHLELVPAVCLLGAATVAYTWLGGMRAVVWTDVVQFAVYVTGAVVALWVLVAAADGGLAGLLQRAYEAGKLRVLDPGLALDRALTLPACLAGGAFLSFGTHGTDQMFVQRLLSARSPRSAGTALIGSGFLVLAQFALFLLLGTALWDWSRAHASDLARDRELLTFVVRELPVGLVGVVLGAVFAAAMSTLSSSLNSSATSLAWDLLPGPSATDATRLRAARTYTVLFGVLQVAIALGAAHIDQAVVTSALGVASLSVGLLLGLFLLALFDRRAGSSDALGGLVAGILILALLFGRVAWPWYAPAGALATGLGGALLARIRPRPSAREAAA